MARHAQAVDRGARVTAVAVLTIVWIAGLAAGFYTIISIAARYGCGADQHGLACRNGGSVVGIVLLLAVIATVTTVTVLLHGRTPARCLVIALGGLLALAGCAFGAHALLSTI